MAVKTPTYWQEEKYQPLIEVETAYGNKVKIPESLIQCWELEKTIKKDLDKKPQEVKAGYLLEIKKPHDSRWDLTKVFTSFTEYKTQRN